VLIPYAEYVNFMLLQAHGPFIYVHWFGTVPSMQRQGYGGEVMKAVSLLSSPLFGAFTAWQRTQYSLRTLPCTAHTATHLSCGMSKEDAKMPWACFGQLSSCLAAIAVHKQALDGHKHCHVQRALHKRHNSSNADCAVQITDIADANNKWTYLEASDQGYHLYIQHGFEVLEELRVTPDAPVMLGMGRPPQ
jgi:hypothetical protein